MSRPKSPLPSHAINPSHARVNLAYEKLPIYDLFDLPFRRTDLPNPSAHLADARCHQKSPFSYSSYRYYTT